MNWNFHYHEDGNYLEITIYGNLSFDGFNKMVEDRVNALRTHNCTNILFDFTRISSMLPSYEIYQRPFESERLGVQKSNRSAVIGPRDYWTDFKFMETVYQNHGYDFRVFKHKQEAVKYLKSARGTNTD